MKQRVFGSYLTATALIAASLVSSGRVHAQEEAEPEAPAAEEPEAPAEPAAPAPEPDSEAQAAAKAEADASVGVKLDASDEAADANANADADAHAKGVSLSGAPAARYGKADEWHLIPYGTVKFDAVRDSTESFFDSQGPYLIARPGTYKGMHGRNTITAKDSRLGLYVTAPQVNGIQTYGKLEVDFFGLTPTDAKEGDMLVMGPIRIRQGFVRLDNPVVDILAGQTHDLFGWGGYFYPATVAFLGVPGQIYHRNPQLRLEKKIDLGGFEILAAAAAVRPGQRDSGIPDAEAGLKFAVDGWTGAAMSGFSRPSIVPVSLGVSAIYRQFELPAFRADPGFESVKENGYGLAASLLLPIIPAKTVEDRSNALTLTGEFSTGTGVADMYTGMEGGSRLPLLPNTKASNPAFIYPQNVDPGLVTFDRTWSLASIDWQAFVANLQYYLPIGGGSVWISGTYSQAKSGNIKELTPATSWGAIFTKQEYIDASVGFAITPAVQLGLSFQTLKQTFADVSPPTPLWGATADFTNGQPLPVVQGTGGEPASARNNRGQLTMAFFF